MFSMLFLQFDMYFGYYVIDGSISEIGGGFDKPLARRMLIYSYPILILGVAGILNQVADKIIFRHIYPDKVEAKTQLAIYGACSKIAMIMAMLTQAFRYAYEPFVFGKSRDKTARLSMHKQ